MSACVYLEHASANSTFSVFALSTHLDQCLNCVLHGLSMKNLQKEHFSFSASQSLSSTASSSMVITLPATGATISTASTASTAASTAVSTAAVATAVATGLVGVAPGPLGLVRGSESHVDRKRNLSLARTIGTIGSAIAPILYAWRELPKSLAKYIFLCVCGPKEGYWLDERGAQGVPML
eukprot:CAMPEP_0173310920 /NCGR_PEP_ID=MMETSP1143-20121109/23209_1 /TAXON_ID=483371 /ORGANISM="non described non described, Strain CCMP2298" /LENGTH=179 /DNA_ID=CAMNT_0014252787 /DNA_START=12 /DNA_END=551 /DNA_ORIENTATION=-